MKFDVLAFFQSPLKKIQVSLKSDNMTGTLHEAQYTFLIISRSVLLIMGNMSEKILTENQNTIYIQ